MELYEETAILHVKPAQLQMLTNALSEEKQVMNFYLELLVFPPDLEALMEIRLIILAIIVILQMLFVPHAQEVTLHAHLV